MLLFLFTYLPCSLRLPSLCVVSLKYARFNSQFRLQASESLCLSRLVDRFTLCPLLRDLQEVDCWTPCLILEQIDGAVRESAPLGDSLGSLE